MIKINLSNNLIILLLITIGVPLLAGKVHFNEKCIKFNFFSLENKAFIQQ